MNAWVHLDTGPVPGGGRSLALMRKDDEFTIVVDELTLPVRAQWSSGTTSAPASASSAAP